MTPSRSDLSEHGIFVFPQQCASVLCDQDDLRLSVWNNRDFLYAQAILWEISEDVLGKTADNRDIGNYSSLMIDADADGQPTPQLDRSYSLNSWPHLHGLYYQIVTGERSTTGLKDDSGGRGSICYVETSDGRPVRVDNYLLPLEEISQQVGGEIKLAYFGFSPSPILHVNSVGYHHDGEMYYRHHIPLSAYHSFKLSEGETLDVGQIPEGRDDNPVSVHEEELAKPNIGDVAPEIVADQWINADAALSLKALRGQVVLLDFWATWCGPCIAGFTHLNQISSKYRDRGFQVLGMAKETRPFLEEFMQKHAILYPLGTNSPSFEEYGIHAIPYVFLIDRGGKISWHGYPDPPVLEEQISLAIST